MKGCWVEDEVGWDDEGGGRGSTPGLEFRKSFLILSGVPRRRNARTARPRGDVLVKDLLLSKSGTPLGPRSEKVSTTWPLERKG